MKSNEVLIRAFTAGDLPQLGAYRCSAGTPWEDTVEAQIRGPLPRRYLASPPRFDGRMLIGVDRDGNVLVIGAHHIEPTLEPDIGYTEAVAVSQRARGTLVQLPEGRGVSTSRWRHYAVPVGHALRSLRLIARLLPLVLSRCRADSPSTVALQNDVHTVHDRCRLVDDAQVEGVVDPNPLLA